jgi:hypothetical protein
MYSRWDEKGSAKMLAAAILWAGLACVMCACPARAMAAPDDLHTAVPGEVHSVADAEAAVRDPRIKPQRAGDPQALQSGAQPNAGSQKGRNPGVVAPSRGFKSPQRGTPQVSEVSAHDVRSLLNTQTRGRVARQTSRPIGSNRAAAGGRELRAPGSMTSPSASTRAALTHNASPAPKLTAAPRASALGGPRVQSAGRIGGAPGGRASHSIGVDGTQLHRKF